MQIVFLIQWKFSKCTQGCSVWLFCCYTRFFEGICGETEITEALMETFCKLSHYLGSRYWIWSYRFTFCWVFSFRHRRLFIGLSSLTVIYFGWFSRLLKLQRQLETRTDEKVSIPYSKSYRRSWYRIGSKESIPLHCIDTSVLLFGSQSQILHVSGILNVWSVIVSNFSTLAIFRIFDWIFFIKITRIFKITLRNHYVEMIRVRDRSWWAMANRKNQLTIFFSFVRCA